jgi:hypothetical protein
MVIFLAVSLPDSFAKELWIFSFKALNYDWDFPSILAWSTVVKIFFMRDKLNKIVNLDYENRMGAQNNFKKCNIKRLV